MSAAEGPQDGGHNVASVLLSNMMDFFFFLSPASYLSNVKSS